MHCRCTHCTPFTSLHSLTLSYNGNVSESPYTTAKYRVANTVTALGFLSCAATLIRSFRARRRAVAKAGGGGGGGGGAAARLPRHLLLEFDARVVVRVFLTLTYTGIIVHFLPKLWEFDINFERTHEFANSDSRSQWDPWIWDCYRKGACRHMTPYGPT
jgi:hypothetical protein